MFFLDANNTYNNNLGLSQKDREVLAFLPDYFLIDEFDFSKFIDFTSKYASIIAFFNERDSLDGDWTSFFKNDPTFSLLRLSFYNTKQLNFFDEKVNLFNNQEELKQLIFSNIEILINNFLFLETNLINLHIYPEHKLELERLISLELSNFHSELYLFLKKINKASKVASKSDFGIYWKQNINDSEIELEQIIYGIKKIFKKTISVFEIVKESSLKYYEENIVKGQKVTPHIAILLTFYHLYQEARESINKISLRHQEYYFKQILKIPLQRKNPDKIHVSFNANSDYDVEVKKNEKLIAGNNENGDEILYDIEETLLLNKANIDNVIGFDFGSENSLFLNQFDGEKKVVDFNLSENNIGFAFGADFLLLVEGTRKISFQFNFTQESANKFISFIEKDLNPTFFSNLFNVSCSYEEGFYEITKDKVETIFHKKEDSADNFKIEVIVLLENIDPPITSLKEDEQRFIDNKSFPYFLFNIENDFLNYYHYLKALEVNFIDVEVEILEVNNLTLSNDFGTIDNSTPFEPFGSQPIIDSSFIIGHPTFFLYPINDLKINLEWYGLPTLEGGFATYYNEYPWEVDNDSFAVKLSYLRNKRWIPENDKQVICLFQDVPDDSKAVSNFRRINEINTRELDLHQPSSSLKNLDSFNFSSKDGFLKLELCYPLEVFGHQQYPDILRDSAIKAVKKKKEEEKSPNEPYTPTLKSISCDIKMKMRYSSENFSDFGFYHIHPIGVQKAYNFSKLLPFYREGSSIIIGLNNFNANRYFSILFQINEGFANKFSSNLSLNWFFYSGSNWEKLNDNELIQDNSNDFKTPGVIKFNFNNAKIDSTGLFKNDCIWLKVESENNANFLNFLQDIILNVTTAKCLNPELTNYANLSPNNVSEFVKNREEISEVNQKYFGFDGSMNENNDSYFLRVSERLRHKNRAVCAKDYEKILLEKFPIINRAKCLSNIDQDFKLSPGKVLIVVVPKIVEDKNMIGVPRYFSKVEIERMEKFLESITPVGVEFNVTNPKYEQVKVKFSLKLRKGFDEKFYVDKLNKGIRSFISPWMYNFNTQVELGQSISSALILNYIDKKQYVDHVLNFSLFHLVDGKIINQGTAKSNSIEINPTSLISILVSDDKHIIIPYDKKMEIDNSGINEMMIDTDYIVDYAVDENISNQKNLTIEKSYKIMPSKDDNNSLKSNFTFYITL